jgi:type II restriction enzyme
MRANTPSIDFSCPHCGQLFQLKSSSTGNPKKIVDAGYDAMIRTIRADRTPNLLLLHHTLDWIVTGLVLIPRVFFTERVIEKRKPLSLTARRSGWVGCNILVREIPKDGKIDVVAEGTVLPPSRVREDFSRVRGLAELPPQMRGWTVDILNVVRKLGTTKFSLKDVYQFEPELKSAHPQNRNVRPKIRQQLQILRDLGLIRFDNPGQYSIS